MTWLRANYTLNENPGMGEQGLYYYYHTMAKALTAFGGETIETKDGRNVKWREELALKLIDLQQANGSWSNQSGRWFEKDPALLPKDNIQRRRAPRRDWRPEGPPLTPCLRREGNQ